MLIIKTKLPAKELSPNARLHWSKKIKYKKIDLEAGYFDTYIATNKLLNKKPFTKYDAISMHLQFYYPTRARHDDDNSIASFKAIRDGIALALGIDDSQFKLDKQTEILYNKEDPHTLVTLTVI